MIFKFFFFYFLSFALFISLQEPSFASPVFDSKKIISLCEFKLIRANENKELASIEAFENPDIKDVDPFKTISDILGKALYSENKKIKDRAIQALVRVMQHDLGMKKQMVLSHLYDLFETKTEFASNEISLISKLYSKVVETDGIQNISMLQATFLARVMKNQDYRRQMNPFLCSSVAESLGYSNLEQYYKSTDYFRTAILELDELSPESENGDISWEKLNLFKKVTYLDHARFDVLKSILKKKIFSSSEFIPLVRVKFYEFLSEFASEQIATTTDNSLRAYFLDLQARVLLPEFLKMNPLKTSLMYQKIMLLLERSLKYADSKFVIEVFKQRQEVSENLLKKLKEKAALLIKDAPYTINSQILAKILKF